MFSDAFRVCPDLEKAFRSGAINIVANTTLQLPGHTKKEGPVARAVNISTYICATSCMMAPCWGLDWVALRRDQPCHK